MYYQLSPRKGECSSRCVKPEREVKANHESEDLIKESERLELDVCTRELVKEKLYVMMFQELLERMRKYQEETMKGNTDKLTNEERWSQKDDKGVVRNLNRIWIPNVPELKNEILHDAHISRYSIHPGSTKMYQDLKKSFWWPNLKREIVEWVSKCDTCQRVSTIIMQRKIQKKIDSHRQNPCKYSVYIIRRLV